MNFATLMKAFDAALVLRDTARRLKGEPAAPPPDSLSVPASGIAGQIEARLTNVVVAALKEAFDRDHARLELERAQLDEQRRRAEEAMRLELRRQAADRELGRLRLLAGTALVGWIASVVLLVARLGEASVTSRGILAASWLLLLGALAAAFTAQGRITASAPAADTPPESGAQGQVSMWLLVVGLALAAASLLF
jgi:hypothetical protein